VSSSCPPVASQGDVAVAESSGRVKTPLSAGQWQRSRYSGDSYPLLLGKLGLAYPHFQYLIPSLSFGVATSMNEEALTVFPNHNYSPFGIPTVWTKRT
jgi:hypothetical protein